MNEQDRIQSEVTRFLYIAAYDRNCDVTDLSTSFVAAVTNLALEAYKRGLEDGVAKLPDATLRPTMRAPYVDALERKSSRAPTNPRLRSKRPPKK